MRWSGSVEPLEGRALLATFTWNSGADGNFNDPTMWTGPNNVHAVPGAGDDAVAPAGNYTISATGSATVNSFVGGSALSVKAGTFTVTGAGNATASSVNNLSVAAGASFHSGRITTIGGSGPISGNVDVAAGGLIVLAGSASAIKLEAGATMTGAGTFDITSSVNLDAAVTGPTNLLLDSGNSPGIGGVGTLTVPSGATLEWKSGFMSGVGGTTNVQPNATLKLDGNGNKALIDRALNNAGTATLANNGVLTVAQAAVFTNTGTFTIQSDQSISGSGTFVNSGTLTKSSASPSGITDITVRFNNNGTVVAQGGILQLDNPGASTGRFDSPTPGGTLNIVGQGYSLNPGTTFTGAGTVHFAAGFSGPASINLNASVSIPNLAIDAAAINGPAGALTVTGTLSLDYATMTLGVLTLPVGSSLHLNGSHTATFLGGTLNDLGTTTMSGAEQFQLGSNALFQNAGSFTVQNDVSFIGQGTFVNYGTFIKTSPVGTGTTDIRDVAFNNQGGTVVLQSGVLQLDNAGSSTGTFNSPNPAGLLSITGKGYSLNAGTSFTGPGTVHFAAGSAGAAAITLSGGVTIPSLAIDSATVTGTGTLTVTTALTINSGKLSIGTLNVNAGAAVNLNGTSTATFDAGIYNNAGSLTLSGAESFKLSGGATFNNSGNFLILNDTTANGGNIGLDSNTFFTNTGTGVITKISLVGTGPTTFSTGTLTNGGVIHVISGQLLLLDTWNNSGAVVTDPNATLNVIGSWNINPGTHVLGSGLVMVGGGFFSPGTITVNTDVLVPNLGLSGGTLVASPTFTITFGTLNWTAGQIRGTGTVAIQAGGTLNISGAANKSLSQAKLANAGVVNWSGTGNIGLDTGAVINNQSGATFNATNDQSITGGAGGTFNNSGTFKKTSFTGVGATTLDIGLTDLQGGLISLISGNLATDALVNLGTISLGVQTVLNVSGTYNQPVAGTLSIAIGGAPATNLFGQLRVSGQANLNGTLNVTLVNNFQPTLGQTTPILTYGSAVGGFATVNLPTVGNLAAYTPSQNATEYDLATTLPAAPTGLALAASSQSGGPNTTRSTTPTFTGSAQPFSGVQIYSVVNNVFTLMAVADVGADGTFTTRSYKAFTPGTYSLVAVAYNAFGSGANSSPFALTVLP